MKLYASVTSERATKGQGGNDFLFLQVKNEKEEPILTIAFEIKGLEKPRIAKVFGEYHTLCELKDLTLDGIDVELYRMEKGNKQKDEVACPVCDKPFKNGTCKECDELVNSL